MASHDEAVVEMLRTDPEMASEYLSIAAGEQEEEGGEAAYLIALKHVSESQSRQRIRTQSTCSTR